MITWYKGERILSAGALQILDDPRLSLSPSSSGRGVAVVVRAVNMADQGRYTCEVNLKDRPIRITHTLEVLGEEATRK